MIEEKQDTVSEAQSNPNAQGKGRTETKPTAQTMFKGENATPQVTSKLDNDRSKSHVTVRIL